MRPWPLLAIAIAAGGCGRSGDLLPPEGSRIVAQPDFNTLGDVVLPDSFPYVIPGGVLIPRGSNVLPVTVWATLGRPAPRAQLNVYLMTGPNASDYCGQNSPDMPAWTHREEGWATLYTVTGFRVYRLPCEVTGIRAILHTRHDDHLLVPPTAAETIVETTAFARFTIRRE